MFYIHYLEHLLSHPDLRSSARPGRLITWSERMFVVKDYVSLLLLGFVDHFGLQVSVLSRLSPIVNRMCWLSAERSESHGGVHECSLGALRTEALLDDVFLEVLTLTAVPIHGWRAGEFTSCT